MEGVQTSIAEIPPTSEVESDFSDLEEELVQSYIKNFHDNIRTSLSLIMKGPRTPFNSLKMTLTRSVDNIRDIGGSERAAPFDQIVLDFERDVQSWKEAAQADLSPLITAEIERLEAERQKERERVQSQMDEASQSLELIKTRKEAVSIDFDAVRDRVGALVRDINEAHNSIEKANKMIEKAKDMIRKAEALLSRSMPIHNSDSQHLEALAGEKITLKAEEAKVAQELAQARAQLATLTVELPENMKREAIMKAEEEKRRRVLLLEEKLKTYVP
jgi:chromosome segregation ATPase